ncbi:MAG: isoaspartyl peptidase/L-asparaginase [Raineya sp.]
MFIFLLNAFAQEKRPAIVIHGGAGVIRKSDMTAEKEQAYRQKLQEALEAGYAILEKGGSSLEAVERAIQVLEESPLFNAGRGCVLNNEGKPELDASIMDGKTLQAGAVAGVDEIKSPIRAARAVMEQSEHVMMVGSGAERFAKSKGLEMVKPSYFLSEKRSEQLKNIKKKEKDAKSFEDAYPDRKYGTVGCVALDKQGNIAAGTSTGGMMNKRFGRVGDSPIIGAGTYADNQGCGVSATGHGEFFIRSVAAFRVNALMKMQKITLQEAAQETINFIGKLGGTGGLIALDQQGNIAMPFNTEGMYRGYIDTNKKMEIQMYKE